MKKIKNDCFSFKGKLLKTVDAKKILLQKISPTTRSETISIKKALGRVLAENITSKIDVPGYDNAAVDGYAVYFNDLKQNAKTLLPIAGIVTAGHPLRNKFKRGCAYRVLTGAPIAEKFKGPDTIIMQEDCKIVKNQVLIQPGHKKGSNYRLRGEDIKSGEKVLLKGSALRPQEIGLSASVGKRKLKVYKKVRVAIFSTGDEIQEPGKKLKFGSIYNSNRYSLISLTKQLQCEINDLGLLPDNYKRTLAALSNAAKKFDFVITSGGVSVGDEDHVYRSIKKLGKIHFWRVAIKPGRPIALGNIKKAKIIGLPGNPVSVIVTFMIFAKPALLKFSGLRSFEPHLYKIQSGFDYKKKRGRREWLRVTLINGGDGKIRAQKYPQDGSGILSSMVNADGLVELSENIDHVKKGMLVDFLPFSEVLK